MGEQEEGRKLNTTKETELEAQMEAHRKLKADTAIETELEAHTEAAKEDKP